MIKKFLNQRILNVMKKIKNRNKSNKIQNPKVESRKSKFTVKKLKDNSTTLELISLFQKIFKEKMTEDFWNWKYSKSKHNLALYNEQNNIVGFYGGMQRELICFGISKNCSQVSDTMITEYARGGIGKKSRLYKLISTFGEDNVGLNKPYFLVYGFPNYRVMKVARLLEVYTQTDKIMECRWPSKDFKTNSLYNSFSNIEHEEVNSLWEDMKNEFGDRIIGVRDYDYIQYRYINHPKYTYNLYSIYDENQKLQSIIIGRKEKNIFRLMDIITLKKHYKKSINTAISIANELNCDDLVFWVTKSQHDLFKTDHSNATYKDIKISIATYKLLDSCKLEDIKDKWWLTAGDSDFL